MPRVYVRAGALLVDGPRGPEDGHVAPDRDRALSALTDSGWQVVLLDAGAPLPSEDTGRAARRDSPSWLVTTDMLDGRPARAAGMRSVLISADRRASMHPERCDVTVRNLFGAAVEILARDASNVPDAGGHPLVARAAGPTD